MTSANDSGISAQYSVTSLNGSETIARASLENRSNSGLICLSASMLLLWYSVRDWRSLEYRTA
jgi:hypothetical protein